jgi:hypothetical protein
MFLVEKLYLLYSCIDSVSTLLNRQTGVYSLNIRNTR